MSPPTSTPRWRNWQTHYLEVVAPARAWRFKSSPGHYRFAGGHNRGRPLFVSGVWLSLSRKPERPGQCRDHRGRHRPFDQRVNTSRAGQTNGQFSSTPARAKQLSAKPCRARLASRFNHHGQFVRADHKNRRTLGGLPDLRHQQLEGVHSARGKPMMAKEMLQVQANVRLLFSDPHQRITLAVDSC